MDYKEITRRNGKVVVFCKIEDLLKEFYGVRTMEEVETHLNSNNEYIIHCPFCKESGHRKHKLYIKGDLSVGHCFVCTRAYVNVTDEVNVKVNIPDFLSKFLLNEGNTVNIVPLTDPEWSISSIKDDLVDYDESGVNYLKGRHIFMEELYKILDFKFLDGNVVMPFKYHGEPFYYQIRFTGDSSIRYFFPPISSKPPYIIERDGIKRICVVEGVFDAISMLIQAPDYIPCAVLGSSISDYQIEFIREYCPEEIVVFMDETSISIGIAKKIRSKIDYCPIRIIKSDGEDPEERMNRILKSGKELQWLKPKVYDNFGVNLRI